MSLGEHALAIGSVILVWWLSTGVVLRLVWLPKKTHRISVAVFTVLAVVGLFGIIEVSQAETVGAAYVGFACALAVWAWHELTFLLGIVSGPRRVACWPEASGWVRFRDAAATVIHHEIALFATMAAIMAATWGEPNQVATWTFMVLWLMRLSAKLNVFVGVRNLSEEFIPPHLRYLTSYFRRARYSPLILVSVVLGSIAMIPLVDAALAPRASEFVACSHSLVATILALGLVEHVLLALPIPDAVLWRWVLRTDRSINQTPTYQCVPRGMKAEESSG